jgi:hypothetical protein
VAEAARVVDEADMDRERRWHRSSVMAETSMDSGSTGLALAPPEQRQRAGAQRPEYRYRAQLRWNAELAAAGHPRRKGHRAASSVAVHA